LGIIPCIEDCCGPETAKLVNKIGESLAVDPIAILTVMIPIVAFLCGSNCYIKPDKNLDWEEPMLIYALLIGKKGTKKSPILKTLTAPLSRLLDSVSTNKVDLLFLDGTLEGLTSQLSANKGEMLQVANEAETFFSRLYSIKGI
jgi:hypothetical protein